MNTTLSIVPTLLQSHWDKLPEEIRRRILSLAAWQHILDRRNNELLNKLHRDLLEYAELKRQWGLGHIEIRKRKCNLSVCESMYGSNPTHTAIHGHYVNNRNQKNKVYLGFCLKDAFRHASDKRSRLFVNELLVQDTSRNTVLRHFLGHRNK